MKSNRSLKEIHLAKHRFPDEKTQYIVNSPIHANSPSNYTLHVDQLASVLKNVNAGLKSVHRHDKSVQSQKNLDIPSIKFQLTSPKMHHHVKGFKEYHSQIDNVEITPFQIGTDRTSTQKNQFRQVLSPLTPANTHRTIIEEPKRPKILNKQRQMLSFFEQFKLGRVLGKGRFGNVYRGQHIGTGSVFAVKQISLEKACRKLIQRLVWQIKIQSFLKHKNCLDLYKCFRQGSNLFMIVELGECSLFDVLREKKYFTEVETCLYITQTIEALIHLHEQGVIHRDLKPQNIVLINNVVKLADFGWSIYIGKNDKRRTFCGTLDYVSPEIVLGAEYDEMVDVWSVGVLCYELCTGHAPFESTKSRQQTYRKILNVELKFPKYLSLDIKDFITRLLIKKPQDRMSLEEAMNHRWMKKYTVK